jgi:KDO2-lipid IV(A) lauroyltransferase
VSLGPLKLARRTGAVLLPCYIDRARDGTFTVHITPPLDLESADDPVAAAANALRDLGGRLTPAIAAQPLLWPFWRPGKDGTAPDRSRI